ncbi:MAG: hypothetical protein RLZZ373_1028 [Pseudomonadota bacterium]|jgi:hypothetical protein
MSIEITDGGKLALRVEVRTCEDGWTQAAVKMPGAGWCMLCIVHGPEYERSTDVQAAFLALTRAVVRQMVADALPGVSVASVHVVAPGAPLDGPKH